jgi:hypothetical protein
MCYEEWQHIVKASAGNFVKRGEGLESKVNRGI